MSEYTADALRKQGRIEEAIQKAKEEIQAGINLEKNYIVLGKCYQKNGNINEAVRAFQQSIQLNSDGTNYEAQYGLANLYNKMKRFADAYRLYKEVDQGTNLSKQPIIHNQLSYCLYMMRRFNRAECEASTALYYDAIESKRTGKKDKVCRIYRLCCLNECERYEQALIHIDTEMAEYKDKDNDVIEQECFALWGLERYEECIKKCNKYLDKMPILNYYLSLCAYTGKNYEMAKKYINQAARLPKGLITYKIFYLKGLIAIALRDDDEAINEFQKSYKDNPKYLEAYLEEAKIYQRQGELKKAERLLDQANTKIDELDEREVELYFHLIRAEIYYRQNPKSFAGTELVDYVRGQLGLESTENEIPKRKLLEILFKYFELYSLSKGYLKNDLIFEKNEDCKIGHGGFGDVYKGTLKGEAVAIKNFKLKITEELPFDKLYESMTSVFHELSNMELLKHKNILEIRTIFITPDCDEGRELFLVTPLCRGGNISEILRNYKYGKPAPVNYTISMKTRARLALQIAEGLNYMHHGKDVSFIHHDMKSMNCLLVNEYSDNGNNLVKICDFGGTRTCRTLHSSFTPGWAAPEIMFANPYDYKIDVYSFGVTLWELYSRRIPFEGVEKNEILKKVQFGDRPDMNLLDPNTPQAIKNLIEKCVKDSKEDRPDDPEIIEILKKCC